MAQEDRLPALNALRAFEAAARHLSFTRAAEELNVTPGAISQQIRQLGVRLKHNANRAVVAGKRIVLVDDSIVRGTTSTKIVQMMRDAGATAELLKFMGYEPFDSSNGIQRFVRPGGNGADYIDIETLPDVGYADLGAGSVHHIAFAVENRAAQLEMRKALADTGFQVTPVIDRDYFFSIYFRTPGGVLFEVATNEPGFARDEDTAHLGEALKLPRQHEHLRARLEKTLQPLDAVEA